uniref:ZP domain-containing protein n=1 Tax=Ciona savignyi TaxID=51511 RepID=H2YP98_CIOSA
MKYIVISVVLLISKLGTSQSNNGTNVYELQSVTVDRTGTNSLTTSVACGDSSIDIRVPTVLLPPTVSADRVMFRGDTSLKCRAKSSRRSFNLKIRINPLESCGSSVKEFGSQKQYSNEVVYFDTTSGYIRSVTNFTCLYFNGKNVPFLSKADRSRQIHLSSQTEVNFNLSIHKDRTYSEESAFSREFPEVSVNQFVYVQIKVDPLSSNKSVSSFFVVQECYASFNSDVRDRSKSHAFIRDGCGLAHDTTVSVLNGQQANLFQWRFQMFKWVNVSVQRVYLICRISHCEDHVTQTCSGETQSRSCTNFVESSGHEVSGNENKSSVPEDFILALGPIFPANSKSALNGPTPNDNTKYVSPFSRDKQGDQRTVHIAVGSVVGVGGVIILSAVLMLLRRYVRKRRRNTKTNTKEDRVQRGFAFVLKSSDDKDVFQETAPMRNKHKKRRKKPKRVETLKETKRPVMSASVQRSVSFQQNSPQTNATHVKNDFNQ